MRTIRRSLQAALSIALIACAVHDAMAQNATVTLSAQKQYIRGFGGISHASWLGDLSATDRTLAFGNATGQLGFTILRIPVTDGNPNSADVATAKAAVAAGAIVFASPWNAARTYASADFAAYATHLNNFVTYMSGQGVDLYAISVQNEPDYGAEAGWGAWSAAACHDFVLNYGATIKGTKLMSCESFNYQKSYYDAILNDSAALANVGVFGTHLYGTAVSAYAYANFTSKGAGKEMWMTEHYTDSSTDANSWPNALGVATEIHNVLVTGQMNAYVFWPVKRFYGPIYTNSTVSKRGWCMAHWSKFVRPGFYRVDATAAPASKVLLSAYKSDSAVAIVIVNNNTATSTLTINVAGSTIASYDKYTTSSSKSLANDGAVTVSNDSMSVSLDAQSVTTLYGTGDAAGGNSGVGGASSTGGAPSTGGTKATGGASNAGGAASTGGAKAVGGASSTGGAKAVGGASSTGGTIAAVGGAKAVGGASSAASMGGAKAAGGASSIGGASSTTGGAQTTGGASSTGVTSATGGATSVTAGGASAAKGGANAVTGGASSSVGVTSTGGSSSASADTNEDLSAPGDASGCGCRVAGEPSSGTPWTLMAMLGAALLGARRRRPKK